MSAPLVSIAIPTLGRPEALQRCLDAIEANTRDYPNYEVIVEHDSFEDRQGCPKVLARALARAKGELIVFIGNDCIPQPGWLRISVECMLKFFPDLDGLVSYGGGYWQMGELATHFIIGRPRIKALGGEIFHTGYSHACCDSELTERCRQVNKYVFCPEAVVAHDHPIMLGWNDRQLDATQTDPVYRLAYDPVRRQQDCDLLLKRATELGFPIRSNFRAPKIPRRLFTIWLGDQPMPPLIERCVASQREFTKGWEQILITNDHFPSGALQIHYVQQAMAARKWVKAVDYLKLWLLWHEGGVYMDADVDLRKVFPDELLTDRMFAGREHNGWIGNGVIGAEAGHPILAECLERVERDFRGDDDRNFESSVQLLTETAHQMGFIEHGFQVYPPEVFTPYDHQGKREEITERTVAYHHYMVSWGYPPTPASIDLRPRLARFGDVSQMKVLNIGIGSGESWVARQLPALNFARIDHVEIHQPYIDSARRKFWVAKEVNYTHGDARDLFIADDDYDLVLMFDVIEHLSAADGLILLAKCPKALVFIPLEEAPRCHREGSDDIPSQDHLSCWTEQQFIDLGFTTEVLPNFHREKGESWDALWAWRV